MTALAASLDLRGRLCLLVGGGERTLNHLALLREAGARVRLVAAEPGLRLRSAASATGATLHERPFTAADLDGVWLAVAVTGDAGLDAEVIAAAEARAVFCESDHPDATLCRPGVIERADLRLTVDTRGGDDTPSGRVDLVGAGPGDPGLLTLDALTALRRADTILHDRLVPAAILDLAHPRAEWLYVGKARSRHSVEQGALNRLLAERARRGERVVRLKGGDPFVFGRGGEEADSLLRDGIPVGVVPGITAASGCATYAGIPLTHRDHAHSVHFLTAHRRDGAVVLDWGSVGNPRQTLAIYMGLDGLEQVCRGLVESGRTASTPAAVVEKGTRPDQRVAAGTLADLPPRVRRLGLASPAMLIVGDVVGERARLAAACTSPVGASA